MGVALRLAAALLGRTVVMACTVVVACTVILARTVVLACAVVLACTVARANAAEHPNIVYILADDLGWRDVGFHGGTIRTPTLDRLAQGGVRLERFYTQPYSTSTRAALLTGRYPMRYGLQTLSILPWSTYGLPTSERLLPQALKEAGY